MKEEKREQWREGRRKTNEGRNIENKYTEKEERKKRRGNWVNRKEIQTWEQREGRSGEEGVRGETGGAEVGVPRYPSLLGADPDLPPPLQLLGPQCPPLHQGGCGRGHRGGGDGGQSLVISFSPKQTELEEFVHLYLPWASLKALQVKIWFPKQFQKQEKRCTEA